MQPATDELAEFIGGFVAGEGCFTGNGERRFRFCIGLGATDTASCDLIRAVLGVGYVKSYPRRKPHHDDEVQFTVQSTRELVEVVVPFMDAHLPPSYKREQFLDWRARLLDHGAPGPSAGDVHGRRMRDSREGLRTLPPPPLAVPRPVTDANGIEHSSVPPVACGG